MIDPRRRTKMGERMIPGVFRPVSVIFRMAAPPGADARAKRDARKGMLLDLGWHLSLSGQDSCSMLRRGPVRRSPEFPYKSRPIIPHPDRGGIMRLWAALGFYPLHRIHPRRRPRARRCPIPIRFPFPSMTGRAAVSLVDRGFVQILARCPSIVFAVSVDL